MVNLAEPQILERLNSVLEPNPSLVLTECDNSVIGNVEEAGSHFVVIPAQAGISTQRPCHVPRLSKAFLIGHR